MAQGRCGPGWQGRRPELVWPLDELAEQLTVWNSRYAEDKVPIEGSGDSAWLGRRSSVSFAARETHLVLISRRRDEPWWRRPDLIAANPGPLPSPHVGMSRSCVVIGRGEDQAAGENRRETRVQGRVHRAWARHPAGVGPRSTSPLTALTCISTTPTSSGSVASGRKPAFLLQLRRGDHRTAPPTARDPTSTSTGGGDLGDRHDALCQTWSTRASFGAPSDTGARIRRLLTPCTCRSRAAGMEARHGSSPKARPPEHRAMASRLADAPERPAAMSASVAALNAAMASVSNLARSRPRLASRGGRSGRCQVRGMRGSTVRRNRTSTSISAALRSARSPEKSANAIASLSTTSSAFDRVKITPPDSAMSLIAPTQYRERRANVLRAAKSDVSALLGDGLWHRANQSLRGGQVHLGSVAR